MASAANLPDGEAGTDLTNDERSLPLLHQLGFGFGSRRESIDFPAKILFSIQGGDRRSGNVGQPGEIEPWDLLLVREHDDGLERQTVKQEVRQHDGRQPGLVAAWNAVEEHRPPVPAGETVVDRIGGGVSPSLTSSSPTRNDLGGIAPLSARSTF